MNSNSFYAYTSDTKKDVNDFLEKLDTKIFKSNDKGLVNDTFKTKLGAAFEGLKKDGKFALNADNLKKFFEQLALITIKPYDGKVGDHLNKFITPLNEKAGDVKADAKKDEKADAKKDKKADAKKDEKVGDAKAGAGDAKKVNLDESVKNDDKDNLVLVGKINDNKKQDKAIANLAKLTNNIISKHIA